MENTIRSIRNALRLSMNGVTAASMRDKGVHYRMNFGVDLMRIRQIADSYKVDEVLAEALWKEDVRELKILATMLYPTDRYTYETAQRWVEEIDNQELREQACRNLFQELPFAGLLVNDWSCSSEDGIRTTGYWLFARLCITHSLDLVRVDNDSVLKLAVGNLKSESMLLRQAALNVLRYYGRMLERNKKDVMLRLAHFENSSDSYEVEVMCQLRFEFGIDS